MPIQLNTITMPQNNNKLELPPIQDRKAKTQQKHRNGVLPRPAFLKMKTENYQHNEYLRDWQNKQKQYRRIKQIYERNHHSQQKHKKVQSNIQPQQSTNHLKPNQSAKPLKTCQSSKQQKACQSLNKIQAQMNVTLGNNKKFTSIITQPPIELKVSSASEVTPAFRVKKKPKFIPWTVACGQIQSFYMASIYGKEVGRQVVNDFSYLLATSHPLFNKTDLVIVSTLLQLGFVSIYKPGDLVYRQFVPLRNVGLILWGQTELKRKKMFQKYICLPGHAIGQQLLFEQRSPKCEVLHLQHGQFYTTQRCKALSECGILFLNPKEFQYIYEDLTKERCKDMMLRFNNLLMHGYLKKRQFHKNLGEYTASYIK